MTVSHLKLSLASLLDTWLIDHINITTCCKNSCSERASGQHSCRKKCIEDVVRKYRVMAALPNVGVAYDEEGKFRNSIPCTTMQSLADAHCLSAVQ